MAEKHQLSASIATVAGMLSALADFEPIDPSLRSDLAIGAQFLMTLALSIGAKDSTCQQCGLVRLHIPLKTLNIIDGEDPNV